MNKYLSLSCIVLLVFLSNCTIQKRTVNKGYFVQWRWNKTYSNSKSNNFENNHFTDSSKIDLLLSSCVTDSLPLEEPNFRGNDIILLTNDSEIEINRLDESKITIKQDKLSEAISKSENLKITSKNNNFNKKKGKQSLTFGILAVISFGLFLLTLLLAFSGISWAFFEYILIGFYIISSLGMIVFSILSLVFLILAFVKPKKVIE